MDTTDKLAADTLRRFDGLASSRTVWEGTWQDIRLLVRPNTEDFHRTSTAGDMRTLGIYDGTAVFALKELASGLQSYLTNPTDRWFSLEIENYGREQMERWNPEALQWLDDVADLIYDQYACAESKFSTALHECYLDLGAFGTACISQEWHPDGHLIFKAIPLADVFISESNDETVDVVARRISWTLRQVQQEFAELPPKLAKMCKEVKDQERRITVIHMVMPRSDSQPPGLSNKRMPYSSIWVCETTKETLKESGYMSLPYHTPRWVKIAGEVYGRGPGMDCLPDIRMLNRMEFTMIKAVQKAVDPPLVVPDDGFTLPLKTHPGATIFKEAGTEEIVPLEHKGNFPVGQEFSDQKREFIRQCFYSDWLKMQKEKVEMTAYEVQDRRDEKLRLMAPVLGRQESELCGPTIQRSYLLLQEHGRIPPAPSVLKRRRLKIGYVSPASRAQTGVKAMSMGRYVQELAPLAQIDPTIMDVIDTDVYAQQLAIARGVPRIILRSPEDVAAIRQQRQAQQGIANAAQVAEPLTKSVKNLADAQAAGNIA